MSSSRRKWTQDEVARRWEESISAILKKANIRQKDLAYRLAEKCDLPKHRKGKLRTPKNLAPEVNKFVKGDPATVERWLGPPSHEYLVVTGRFLDVSEDEFRSLYQRARFGDDSDQWSASWPGLRDPVVVPSPVAGYAIEQKEERDPSKVADDLARRRVESTGVRQPFWVWIVGPAGSGRRTLARQVRSALDERRIEGMPDVGVLEEEPDGGWRRARAERSAVVAVTDRESDVGAGEYRLRPAEWGAPEIRAVVDGLLSTRQITPAQAASCRDFADQVALDPELLGDGAWPGQVIALLRDVAERGAPRDPAEARRTRLDNAWSKALSATTDPATLGAFGPAILARYFADLFAASPASPWWRVPLPEACRALERAAANHPRPDVGLACVRLRLEQLLETGRSHSRTELERIVKLATAPTGEALVHVLEKAGLLKVVGDEVEPADVELCMLWAAQGLATDGFRLERWERLIEPDALRLARECAIMGGSLAAVLETLEGAPEWACVDRACWAIVFAASAPGPLDPGTARKLLVPAWAGALWAHVFGTFDRHVPDRFERRPDPGPMRIARALRSVSRTYREVLPELDGDDLVAALRRHVPRSTLDRADAWGAGTPTSDGTIRRDPWVVIDLYRFADQSRWAPDNTEGPCACILDLAPWQCPVLTGERCRLLHLFAAPERRTPWPEILEWKAEGGHAGARDFLAGAALRRPSRTTGDGASTKREDAWHWRTLPVEMRLRWIARAGTGEDARTALAEITAIPQRTSAFESPECLDLLVAAMRRLQALEPKPVRTGLRASGAGSRLASSDEAQLHRWGLHRIETRLAMHLAEALEIPEPLEAALDLPNAELRDLHVEMRLGRTVVGRAVSEHFVVRGAWKHPGTSAWEFLREREALSREAAASLYRIGRPKPLLRLWREGSRLRPPKRLREEMTRVHKLSAAVNATHDRLAASAPPGAACTKTVREWLASLDLHRKRMPYAHLHPEKVERAYSTFDFLVRALRALESGEDPLAIRTDDADPDCTPLLPNSWFSIRGSRAARDDASVRAAAVLLIAIFVDPPAKLGPEVDAWIERLVGDGPLACVEPAPWESDDWDLVARAAAGRLLLAEHSRAPIDDWVHGRVDLPDSRSPRTRDKTHPWPEEVLLEHLRTDAAALDHGWHEGCDGPKRDVLLRLGEREPRDWFFHAALGERGPVRLVWADKHQADPRVVPLLRALYREASNASGRAYWAILLHRHERWCHEIVGELRSWACDDQEPFSDDWAVESLFHFDASWASGSDSYVIRGGWRAMLHLLTLIQAERTDDWIRPGVKRLWEKVRAPGRCLRAPSSDAEERHVTLRTPYDDLYDEQGVLMTLLHRLGEFEVLDRFIDASGDAPEPGDGRQEAFDQWRAHATSAQLHRALDASDWRAECVAATLAERGDPAGPDWACRTLAAAEAWDDDLTGTLSWLAVHAPARMLEAIDDLFRRLPKGRHALRVWLTAFLPALGAHERGARMFLRQSFS